MESRFVKIPRKSQGKFPYIAKDKYSGSLWLVTGKVRRAYVTATLISRTRNYVPFEFSCVTRQSSLEKIDRMRITFQIGDNSDVVSDA